MRWLSASAARMSAVRVVAASASARRCSIWADSLVTAMASSASGGSGYSARTTAWPAASGWKVPALIFRPWLTSQSW